MNKDITPRGMNATVRGPLAAGTIASKSLKDRVDTAKMMKAPLKARIAEGAD